MRSTDLTKRLLSEGVAVRSGTEFGPAGEGYLRLTYSATFDDIREGTQSGELRLELKLIGAVYEGQVTGDGAEINGVWQQGANALPLTFRRPGAGSRNWKNTMRPAS